MNIKLRKWHWFHYFLDYFFKNVQKYTQYHLRNDRCVEATNVFLCTKSQIVHWKLNHLLIDTVPMTFKINNQPNWKVHAILIAREKLFLVYHRILRHATCLFKSDVWRPIHFNYWLSRMSIRNRNIRTETKKFHKRNNNEKLNDLFVC